MDLYGVGGVGKTTMCKTLFNILNKEFDAKVCHVELSIRIYFDM
jgi:tRNA uridine 5-carbamoylmethylation protein Kti12